MMMFIGIHKSHAGFCTSTVSICYNFIPSFSWIVRIRSTGSKKRLIHIGFGMASEHEKVGWIAFDF